MYFSNDKIVRKNFFTSSIIALLVDGSRCYGCFIFCFRGANDCLIVKAADSADKETRVKLNVQYFDIEHHYLCEKDYLEIRDGNNYVITKLNLHKSEIRCSSLNFATGPGQTCHWHPRYCLA